MINHRNISTVYTIGHSNRTLEEFIEILRCVPIKILVDVRAYPQSQRYPHFSEENLRRALETKGIIYHWAGRQLGGKRKGAKQSKHVAIHDENLRAYADYMESDIFQKSIVQLINMASSANISIMCAEKLPEHCHRQFISDYMLLRGLEVLHLVTKDELTTHQLNPLARRESQELIYDRGVQRELNL